MPSESPPNREKGIFEQALDLATTQERVAFLKGACGADAAMLDRLMALLRASEGADGFLPDAPQAAPTVKLDLPENDGEAIGSRIGHYKLLQKVGEGGCGVVYMAEQEEPVRRRVAVKVIKLGMDTRSVVARFEAERQALAMMEHPNIARVLDAGTTDKGRPYFVMELVRGIRITDYCDQANLSTQDRLDLFMKVCHAIQHAHQKGIIHRDLKPSNILVTLHDGVPVPKVIDFGIAKAIEQKLTDKTLFTELHQFIGTPAYMSPEQAEMSGLDIDTRSDIYSLGVLLYELLTGKTPFDGRELLASGIDALRKTIREIEPAKPSTRLATLQGEELTTTARRRSVDSSKLLNLLRGDLDWIVMKCLEKDRSRRYDTPNALALDLKRHLDNEPVQARPPNAAYKFQKAFRRNKLAFGAAAAVAAALVIGILLSTWQAVRATRAEKKTAAERDAKEEARREALQNARLAKSNEVAATKAAGDAEKSAAALQRTLVASDFAQGVERLDSGNGRDGLSYLARAVRTDPDFWPAGMRLMSSLSSGRFPLRPAVRMEQNRVITTHRWNPKQDLLFTSDGSSRVDSPERFVWDARTGRRLYPVTTGKHLIVDPHWSRDGSWLVSFVEEDKTLRAWEARTGREVTLPPLEREIKRFTVGGDAKSGTLVVGWCSDDSLGIWKIPGGELVARLVQDQSSAMDAFGVSDDGRLVYGAYNDATLSIWNAADGAPVARISTRPHRVHRDGFVTFTPDNRTVIVRSEDGKHVKWWHLGEENANAEWFEFADWVDVRLLPSGNKVALATYEREKRLQVAIHDLNSGQRIANIQTQRLQSFPIFLSDDDDYSVRLRFSILGSIEANVLRLWDLETGALIREILTAGLLKFGTLSPDGRRVLTMSLNHDVMLWDIFSGSQLFSEPLKHDQVSSINFSPDGEKLVTYDSQKSRLQVWDTRTGQRLIEPFKISNVDSFFFPKNGESLIAYERTSTSSGNFLEQTSGRFHLLDLSARPVLFESLTEAVKSDAAAKFTPDGTRVVVCRRSRPDESDQICVWDAATRQLQQTIPLPPNVSGWKATLQISPDGKRAAIGCSDGPVRVWDLSSGELLHELAHAGNVSSSELSRDGSLLATGTGNGKVKVWNFNTGAALFDTLNHGSNPIMSISFSHDGRLLASSSQDFKLRVVDAKTGAQKFEPVPLPSIINALPFSSDNQFIAATPFSEEVFIIEASTGKVVRKLPHPDACRVSRFSPDGSILAVGTGGDLNRPVGEVYLWNWREGTLIGSPLNAKGAAQYMEFSDDGSFLAVGTLHSVGTVQVWDVSSGQALIEPVEERSQVASVVDFNPSATRVVASWKNGIVRLIDLPPRGTKQPGWLPAFAEAVAGQRLMANRAGVEMISPQELDVLREKLAGPGTNDAFSAWARWFVRDSGERTISPASKVRFTDYVGRLRRSSDLQDLQKALRLYPSDAITHARIGLVLLDSLLSASELDANKDVSARLRVHWEETAAWYGRRAVQVEPGNAEAWALHAEILQRLGRKSELGEAVNRAIELVPARAESRSPNALYLKALTLAAENKWSDAAGSFDKAINAVVAEASKKGRSDDGVPLLGVLAAIEPPGVPAGFQNVTLPPPIPGTSENFDRIPEGQLPAGWMATHEPFDAPKENQPDRLDTASSVAFADWLVVSASRAYQGSGSPLYSSRALLPGTSQLVNERLPIQSLSGRYLYALSANRDSSHVQYLITPAYNCSGRSGVHVAFNSAYIQAGRAIASLEYSIDDGATWLPVNYRINARHVVQDAGGKVDAVATLTTPRHPFPLFFDKDGTPRGLRYRDFIGAKVTRELDPHIEALRPDVDRQLNRLEVHRLPKADGQAKVRLRFAYAGRDGWYWAIDGFGLHEIPRGQIIEPVERIDITRDPPLTLALAVATSLGMDMRGGIPNLPKLISQTTAKPGRSTGNTPADERRSLDARLLARRAFALAGDNLDDLKFFSVMAPMAGECDLARVAAKKTGGFEIVDLPTAGAVLATLWYEAEERSRNGDPGAVIQFEAAHVVYEALTGTTHRELLDRLSAAELLARTETLIKRGARWRYSDEGRNLGTEWRAPDYDDSLWLQGEARFGYGGDGEKTVVEFGPNSRSKFITTYFRTTFDVQDSAKFVQLRLGLVRDDGAVVYLNGIEVARQNMPTGEIKFSTRARTIVNDPEEQRFFLSDLPATGLRPGRNLVAVEIHQESPTSSDLGFDLELEAIGGATNSGRSSSEIAAEEERLGIPRNLRSVLWVARARRARLASDYPRAMETLERAAALNDGNPSIEYERAMIDNARGDAAAALANYQKAVTRAVGLKSAAADSFALFLPKTVKSALEPLRRINAIGLIDAAERLNGMSATSKNVEREWLIRWSDQLDPTSPQANYERARVLVGWGDNEAALALADAALKTPAPAAGAPPRAFRDRIGWLSIRERALRNSGQNEQADKLMEEIRLRPPRDPKLPAKAIDLAIHYNASLYGGRAWHSDQNLARLPESFRPRDGIVFDLRGVIQLNSGVYPESNQQIGGRDLKTYTLRPYPNAVTGISVAQKADRLHFLGGCIYGVAKRGTEVARITVHYEDDTTAVIPLLFEEDTFEWALARGLDNFPPDRLAWMQSQPTRGLAIKTWANPHPEKLIRSFDFTSARGLAAPFLVAVTLD